MLYTLLASRLPFGLSATLCEVSALGAPQPLRVRVHLGPRSRGARDVRGEALEDAVSAAPALGSGRKPSLTKSDQDSSSDSSQDHKTRKEPFAYWSILKDFSGILRSKCTTYFPLRVDGQNSLKGSAV